jgi:Protein of unknown function (DUF3093)
MRVYRERLGAPPSWWLVTTGCVALLGTTLWAGLSLSAAALIYSGLEALTVAALATWGSARIVVTSDALAAGRRRLPVSEIAGATALDRAQAAALRGPLANPAAVLLLRPWLAGAVYVEVAGQPASQPYWLLGTRRPGQLAAAIEQARTAGGAGGQAGHASGGDVARPASGAVG